MKKITILLATVLLTVSVNAKDLTQFDLNQASKQHYEASDFMLNKAYKKLMGALEKNRKAKLKSAQEAWLKFRDTNSEFVSSAYEGGSMAPLIHSQALINITENRTAQLMKMYLNATTP
jgi:uncharacterized protein YecT (DUF1311 family)